MRLLFVVIGMCLLASCHKKGFPVGSAKSAEIDSFIVEYHFHDTTIKVEPVETTIHDTLPCPSLDYQRSVSGNGQTVTVKAHGGKLSVSCNSDSLQLVISLMDKKIREITRARRDSTIVQVVEKPVKTYPSILWWSLGFNVLSLVGLYFSIKAPIASATGSIVSLFKKFLS